MLKKMYEMLWEELDGAEEYAKWALSAKADYPDAAKMFYDISQQEMAHANMLADTAEKMIRTHPGITEGDKAIHAFVRDMQIEKGNRAKVYQSQFK